MTDPVTTWTTGAHYQLVHSGILLLVPLCKRPKLAGCMLTAGIFLFSGSLYALVLTGNRAFGPITPIGGLLMTFAWIALML